MITYGKGKYGRPCRICDLRFIPTSRGNRTCDKCKSNIKDWLIERTKDKAFKRRVAGKNCTICKKLVSTHNQRYIHGVIVCVACRFSKNKASERLKLSIPVVS